MRKWLFKHLLKIIFAFVNKYYFFYWGTILIIRNIKQRRASFFRYVYHLNYFIFKEKVYNLKTHFIVGIQI